ncbi:MAG TPA: 16S rRNA (adenine(1518)-N(6)/adenine(1519)-N(6))-dimethyltransferase RsmA [Bryobacteraceae bacterium]|nr:16S rRNA (adenine(1518)-N(6)/adenine(1519)-N(6))-dimethyltransferase RsmA [Bryobacteraceae bacterium]
MPRRLGQHFLTRKSILERIAAAAAPDDCVPVVEIGPGKGALTEHLLPRAPHVYAIEVDTVLVHYLQAKFRDAANLTVVNNDVLKTNLAQWGPVAVAGNLPYYITSPIVERVLALGALLRRAVFLMQKEVGERLTTPPGSRKYGYLTVQTAVAAEARVLFAVPPGAFRPPPKVESAVVLLAPRTNPLVEDVPAFLRFASLCFRQKRKTLRNNLAGAYAREMLDAQPEAGMRAEQLGIEQIVALWQRLNPSH